MIRWAVLVLLFLASIVPALAQTQVPSFPNDPATCDPTRGLLYYNTASNTMKFCSATNTWSAVGGPGKNMPGIPVYDGPNVIYAANYGVLANWKEFYGTAVTVTVTSGLATVTCTGCFTSTAVDGGKTITVTNAGGVIASDANYTTSVSMFPAGTTISSVQSANAATMSQNATGSCSGSTGLSCIFSFGTNDDAAWTAVDTAFQALNTCAMVVFPAGLSNWDTVNKFNTAPASCTGAVQNNTATLTNSGPFFIGAGPSGSKIVLTPAYLAAVVAGTCSTSCSFNIPNVIVKDIGMTGYGQSNAGVATVAKLFGNGTGSYYENVSLSGFMGGDTSVNNVGTALTYSSAMNFKSDGFGGNGVLCSNYCWVNGNSYVLDNFRTNFTCGGGFCYSFGMGLGTAGTFVNGGTDYICGPAAHCYSQNDNITYENATNAHQIYQNQGGTLYLTGMHMLAATTNTTGLYAPNNNSLFYLSNSDITGGASANSVLVSGTGVKIYDNCGNIITGPVSFGTALFFPCPDTAYTVTVPAVAATGTGACATITTQTGNMFSGSLKCTGTTGASTIVFTPGITAQNGWNCKNSQDITTVADTAVQTGINTGTCTLTFAALAQNDVVMFNVNQF